MAEPNLESTLSQKDAEQTAISLNLVFNNAVFFGAHHPSTHTAAENFATKINTLEIKETTFLKNGESFYFEKWGVDSKINSQRTLAQFNKSGVESVTFRTGMTVDEVKAFVKAYMDAVNDDDKNVDDITTSLENDNVTHLLVNYITFQKVTKDEKVVDADLILTGNDGETFGNTAYGRPARTTSSELDALFVPTHELDREEIDSRPIVPTSKADHTDVFELTSLFNDVLVGSESSQILSVNDIVGDNSSELLKKLNGEGTGTGSWGLPLVKDQFKALGVEITQGELKEGEKIDYDQVFNSLITLSDSLKQNSEVANRIRSIEEQKEILSEVEELTFNTIVQIVRREFESGKPSSKKLAMILRRIAPSAEELRKLLPKLKTNLLEDGYTVSDFLQLTMELERELSSDHALDGLFKEAADFGVDRDEMIATIMENPGESSRLLLQAAEIQKRMGEGYSVSSYLEKMIEDMTSSTVMGQIGNESNSNIHEALTNIINSVESSVLEKLRESDAENKFVDDLAKNLKSKFPDTVEKIKSEWLLNKIGNAENTNDQDGLLKAISLVSRDKEEMDHFRNKLENLGEKFGYSEEDVEKILKRNKMQEELRKRRADLHVLNPKSTIHFVKRYIAEFKRYNHPFSLVLLSSQTTMDENLRFIDRISLFITDTFRTLDIVGQVTVKGKTLPLIILPMTGSVGLTALRDRFHAIPDAGEYIISAVAVDESHRSLSFERIMKKLIKKHILLETGNASRKE